MMHCFYDVISHDVLPTATANIINVFLMRNHELKEGIAVTDTEGREVGFSVIAAKKVS